MVDRLGGDEEVVPGVEVPRLASHRRRHLRQRVHLRRRAFEVHRVGGRLASYADQWVFSPWAYDVTSRGLRWEWIGAPPSYRPFYQAATPLLESFVQTLLDSGAIEKTSFLAFQGPLFSVAKKGTDKRRVILDLSTLNKHVLCASFKMTTVERVRLILPQGVWTVSLDLKEAYYHVPIHPNYRKFLGFRIGAQKYRFRALPFGLNIAPKVFTRLTNVVVARLREKGVWAVAYLDDWLIWADSSLACAQARDVALQVLQQMGFLVNLGKSRLQPSQQFEWLGIDWDTRATMISIPPLKRRGIKRVIRSFLAAKSMSRRSLERVLGKLQHASIVDPVGKTALKFLNHHMVRYARKGMRDKIQPIPHSLCSAPRRWLMTPALSKRVLWRPPPATLDIHTNASLTGCQ